MKGVQHKGSTIILVYKVIAPPHPLVIIKSVNYRAYLFQSNETRETRTRLWTPSSTSRPRARNFALFAGAITVMACSLGELGGSCERICHPAFGLAYVRGGQELFWTNCFVSLFLTEGSLSAARGTSVGFAGDLNIVQDFSWLIAQSPGHKSVTFLLFPKTLKKDTTSGLRKNVKQLILGFSKLIIKDSDSYVLFYFSISLFLINEYTT